METWDIRSLDIEPHRPVVLRSDEETRAPTVLVAAIGFPCVEFGTHLGQLSLKRLDVSSLCRSKRLLR